MIPACLLSGLCRPAQGSLSWLPALCSVCRVLRCGVNQAQTWTQTCSGSTGPHVCRAGPWAFTAEALGPCFDP